MFGNAPDRAQRRRSKGGRGADEGDGERLLKYECGDRRDG